MTDKKILLDDEELDKVSGGACANTIDPNYNFQYTVGYETEICDNDGIFGKLTHHATVTKRGFYYNLFGAGSGYYPVYYFEGDPDINGWYSEEVVADLPYHNHADATSTAGRLSAANITPV